MMDSLTDYLREHNAVIMALDDHFYLREGGQTHDIGRAPTAEEWAANWREERRRENPTVKISVLAAVQRGDAP